MRAAQIYQVASAVALDDQSSHTKNSLLCTTVYHTTLMSELVPEERDFKIRESKLCIQTTGLKHFHLYTKLFFSILFQD